MSAQSMFQGETHYDGDKKLSQFDIFDTYRTLIYRGACLENIL